MVNHIGNSTAQFRDHIPEFQSKGDQERILKRPRDANMNMNRGTGVQLAYHGVDENFAKWGDGRSSLVEMEHYRHNKAELSCAVEPQVGTVKINITTELRTNTQRTVKTQVGSSDLQFACKIQWNATIELRAIETDTRLLVRVESKKPVVAVNIIKDIAKTYGTGEEAEQWKQWVQEGAKRWKKAPLKEGVEDHIENYGHLIGSMASNMEGVLNQQGRFIFPGGGTFDMKNPVFSREGYLQIGLTFREGE
ncbi:hypothetical protein FPANT_1672 [Fusarium pseudoanthophilum]|uniref:Uncharacterized protein n=1 Tax=Fusarium pseudoanthophilum TaxID=48495 RepID=A0A8H5PRA9_9HYPO|nr:hypothetical protein FPANT_1672 [Fusarium pseudoanthophilum]